MNNDFLNSNIKSMSFLVRQRAVLLICLTVMGSGILILLGLIFNFSILKHSLSTTHSMVANSAFGFALAGLGLGISTVPVEFNSLKISRLISLFCGISLFALGITALMENLLPTHFNIDELMVRGEFDLRTTSPGRMSPMSALNFSFLGVILLLRQWRPCFEQTLSEVLAVTLLGLSGLALLGYLIHPEGLFHQSVFTSMSWMSALLFTLLAGSILLSTPAHYLKALRYLLTFVAVSLSFKMYLAIGEWLGTSLPTFVAFYPVIMLSSLLAGVGPGLFALILTTFIVIIWIFEPVGLLVIGEPINQVALLLFLVNGLLINLVFHLYRRNRQKVIEFERAQAVMESEARYQTLFKSIDEGFCVINMLYDKAGQPVDYRFVEVNPAFEQQTGLTQAEGKTIREMVPNFEPFWFDMYGQVASTGKSVRFQNREESLQRWFDVYAFRVDKPEERRVAVLFSDITERKLAEAQVHSDAERLAALLDAQRLIARANLDRSALLQLILDTLMRLTGAEGGSLEMVDGNEMVYESATGLAKAFTGLRLKAKDSLSGLCVATGQLQRSNDTETDPRVERAACRKIGLRSMIMIPLRYGLDAFGVLKLMSSQVAAFDSKSEDTLRLMAEFLGATIARQSALNAVMVSEQRMDLAFRATQDGIWDWNMETDEVYYSSRWKAMLGYEENEIEPRFNTVKQLLHPDDLESVSRHVEEVMRGDHDINIEFRMRHKDGHYIDILSRGFPVQREPNGPIIRIVGTHFDLTESKHAEKALKEADRRKDEFLATLAHELRNPLTPISNGLHILQTPNIDNATRERIHLMMERQLKHMVRLVDELMEISRITRGMIELRKEKIDLSEAINAAVETSQPLIEAAKHQIEINLPAEPLMVEADKVRLTQVIANILNNAAKYTPENGHIWLTARREGAQAIVSIRDNGIGIAADMLSKVFNLFTQVGHHPHQMQSGLGIGLTLVHDLVKLHGGTVKANSEGLGQGSEFVVGLPLVKVTLEPLYACQSSDQVPTTFNLPSQRVLVVDDNQDIAESHALILRQLGVEVTVAYSGPAALEAIATERPSVVLLDIGMPEMNGYEVARRIRQLPEGQVIMLIAITGWGQEEDLRQSQKAGFNHHLVKPVDLSALKELLMTRPQERKAN
jgi:PAS domain S-box-containing protein